MQIFQTSKVEMNSESRFEWLPGFLIMFFPLTLEQFWFDISEDYEQIIHTSTNFNGIGAIKTSQLDFSHNTSKKDFPMLIIPI